MPRLNVWSLLVPDSWTFPFYHKALVACVQSVRDDTCLGPDCEYGPRPSHGVFVIPVSQTVGRISGNAVFLTRSAFWPKSQ